MAVLIEAISVVIRCSTIMEKYPGGWEKFVNNVPNNTLCSDSEVLRVGFMTPVDTEAFINHLAKYGINYLDKDLPQEAVVIDQQHGLSVPCNWVEVGHMHLGSVNGPVVAMCRAVGSETTRITCPEGWNYDESLSKEFDFVPTEETDQKLKFLRHVNGNDIFLDLTTGKEVFVGRPKDIE